MIDDNLDIEASAVSAARRSIGFPANSSSCFGAPMRVELPAASRINADWPEVVSAMYYVIQPFGTMGGPCLRVASWKFCTESIANHNIRARRSVKFLPKRPLNLTTGSVTDGPPEVLTPLCEQAR